VHVGVPIKCGLWAKAASENATSRHSAHNRAIPYFTGRMINLQSSMEIHTVKSLHTYTTEHSVHYKASIHRGLLHALRGVYPKRIVSSTTQDNLSQRPEGMINSTSQNMRVAYTCMFVKLFSTFQRLFSDIGRNMELCFLSNLSFTINSSKYSNA